MTTALIIGAGLAALIAAIWLYARSQRTVGAAAVQRDAAERESEHARERREIDERVARLSPDDLDGGMRKYTRD